MAVKPVKKAKKASMFQSVKGMHDILPQDQAFWERARRAVKEVADCYNFIRIDTPILEDATLFERGIGLGTDIVEKEMFTLKTNDRQTLALRPEFTASIMRAYLQHGLSHLGQPLKLYTMGPLFRHEQPQEGRYRQHHQADFEIIGGESDSIHDAEAILTAVRFLEKMKLNKLSVKVNTIGCKTCRPLYRKKLLDYYRNKAACKDCKRRLTANPLRVLDCKNKECQPIKENAPTILDSICCHCNDHFKITLEYLEEMQISYQLDHTLVRGLDYYNRTVFEVFAEVKDLTLAIAGGGRYDYLSELLGGKVIPAVGWGLGLERVLVATKAAGVVFGEKPVANVFFVHVGNMAKRKSLYLIESLRKNNVCVQESLGKDSLKSQLRLADKKEAKLALIFGQKEAFEGTVIIRDLQTGAQEVVLQDNMVKEVKKRL